MSWDRRLLGGAEYKLPTLLVVEPVEVS